MTRLNPGGRVDTRNKQGVRVFTVTFTDTSASCRGPIRSHASRGRSGKPMPQSQTVQDSNNKIRVTVYKAGGSEKPLEQGAQGKALMV